MKVSFGEKKYFQNNYNVPPDGHFALDPDKWNHCREQFASKFLETTSSFLFSHPIGKGEDIAHFIVKFESILGIDNPSTFCKTCRDSVLWIEPSKFWLNCQIKRSLLTILLRCGMNYSKSQDNFDVALLDENFKETLYLRETKSAILRFMFGFTKFTGIIVNAEGSTVHKHGWKEEFCALDEVTIRKKLTLPEGELIKNNVVGIESLWN